jgi:hypothetical protein
MRAKDVHGGRRLFHYTSLHSLPPILREGISRGEVPLSPSKVLQGPTLTTSLSATVQHWREGSGIDKAKVRLSVRIPDDDERLEAWRDVCRRYQVPKWWQRALDSRGQGKFWFVFWGTVLPAWITAVEVRGTGDDYSAVADLAALVQRILAESEKL